MNANTTPSFAVLVQAFFSEYLLTSKRASGHTIASYRDTLRLLLRHIHDTTGKAPTELRVTDLNAQAVLSFLADLEQGRGCSVRTRNVRLAAVRSFFRFVALRDPESLPVVSGVLSIPVKRGEKRLVGYLSRVEIEAIIEAPDRSSWSGRRDHALLLTIYNTGARVSEVTNLKRNQVTLDGSSFVHLHGKGRKDRRVPLWNDTAQVLRAWLDESANAQYELVFTNVRRRSLSRDGVAYILQRASRIAETICPNLTKTRVTPHLLRHSTAMHLLQSGVDMSVIALWLGHESIETTHMYVEADLASKERALETLEPIESKRQRFRPTDELMAFLDSL